MSKFMVTHQCFDGKDICTEEIGVVKDTDLDAFVAHLFDCGYEGQMTGEHGCFNATLEIGWIGHHVNLYVTIRIDKVKKYKLLSPTDWKDDIRSFTELGYTKTQNGVYAWENDDKYYEPEEDDFRESDLDYENQWIEDELDSNMTLDN